MAKITFDSHEDAGLFAAAVALLGGTPLAETTPVATPAKKTTAAKPAPVVEPEPEPEPEEEEDLLGGGEEDPTVQDALDLASAKVQDGKAPEIKKVLVALGVKKVSELDGNVDDLKTFIAKVTAL